MLIIRTSATVLAALLAASGIARADQATGPDPYASGFGFDQPNDPGASAWGGWSRGALGTIWAEWDQFTISPNPQGPGVGSSGTSSATLGWNPGTFVAGSGNLYNFGGVEIFTVNLDGAAGPASGPVMVALQTETWGTPLGFDSLGAALPTVTLNGVQWDTKTITHQDPAFASVFGEVLLEHLLFTWILDAPAASYSFVLQGGPHLSLTQLAVDVGPAPVPLPAAAWLLGSALVGVAGIARRRDVA